MSAMEFCQAIGYAVSKQGVPLLGSLLAMAICCAISCCGSCSTEADELSWKRCFSYSWVSNRITMRTYYYSLMLRNLRKNAMNTRPFRRFSTCDKRVWLVNRLRAGLNYVVFN